MINKRLLTKCQKLLLTVKDGTLPLTSLINEINTNNDLKRSKCSIPNAIEFFNEKNIKVINNTSFDLNTIINSNVKAAKAEKIRNRNKKLDHIITDTTSLDDNIDNTIDEELKEDEYQEENELDCDAIIDGLIEDSLESSMENLNELDKNIKASKYGDDSVRWYLNLISHTGFGRLLTAEEEIEYCNRAQAGDKEAERIMVENNLKLVFSIAKRYFNVLANEDNLDIIQAGNLGLMKAIHKFDTTKGNRFSTYATWWIRQSITRQLADEGRLIRLPVHMVEQCRYIKQACADLTERNSCKPTDQEIADYLNENHKLVSTCYKTHISAEEVNMLSQWYDMSNSQVSIYAPIGEEDDSMLCDFIPADESLEEIENNALHSEMKDRLQQAFEMVLTHRETEVIKRRFGFNDSHRQETLESIAVTMDVTRERVRQIECKALRKLRSSHRAKDLLKGFIYY